LASLEIILLFFIQYY